MWSTPPESEAAAWLRLTLVPGVGYQSRRALLQAFGLPTHVFTQDEAAIAAVVGEKTAATLLACDNRVAVDTALAWAGQSGNHLLSLADATYPQALLQTADPPLLLYVKGRVELLARPMLAVVGSRNATRQGELDAEAFSAHLSAAGLTIASGLALGIDAAAHKGGLKHPGSTVAVIGTGIDRIYPSRNEELARAVAEHGAIISDYPLGMGPLAANFPRRNRIIAGMALGCLVVEAAEQSGSLITARLAADANREVFAIPGSIHSALARGCHRLIRQGAKLVESAADILEELQLPVAAMPAPPDAAGDAIATPLSEHELNLIKALGDSPCNLETLVTRSGLTPDALLAMLLPMELDGRVASLPGGRYQKLG